MIYNGKREYPPTPCVGCGVEFIPTWNRQTFCNLECRKIHGYKKKPGVELLKGLTCARMQCTNVFDQTSTAQRFCSRFCRKKSHFDPPSAEPATDTMGPQKPETRKRVEEALRHVLTPELTSTLMRYRPKPHPGSKLNWRTA